MFGEPEVHIGEIDKNGDIRALFTDAANELAIARVDARDVAQDLRNAHNSDVFGADDALLAGSLHLLAAEPGEGRSWEVAAQGGDEVGAVGVSGGFAGRQKDARIGDGRSDTSSVSGDGGGTPPPPPGIELKSLFCCR